MDFDPDHPYHLDPRVALRPESFGALAYHYGHRRLTLVRDRDLARLLTDLAHRPSVADALAAASIPERRRPGFTQALARLAQSGFLQPGPAPVAQEAPAPPATPGTIEATRGTGLTEQLKAGLAAPICLTWEWTYACNLQCVHCLSSSGRRDPRELTTDEMYRVVDDLASIGVFYVNVGGGEPLLRPDFFDVTEYCVSRGVGVKFSTNGARLTADRARQLAALDYVDVQISLDGIDAATNDAVRGSGSYDLARQAMDHLAAARFGPFKINVVMTRHNVGQLDDFEALADHYGAELRLTRLRPSGRAVKSWHELHLTADQQHHLYRWLLERPQVLTGDSFFHLSAFGEALPGLNLCGAGRVVCLIDPVGDVYACPFVLHEEFKAGSVRDPGGFGEVWRSSDRFADLRQPQSAGACASCGSYDACQGGCLATKFFTGLPLDGPDPECVHGHGTRALAALGAHADPSRTGSRSHSGGDPDRDHSWTPVHIGRRRVRSA